MHRNIRCGVAAILFFSILFLAQNRVSRAAQLQHTIYSAREARSQSVLLAPKDCVKDKNGKVKDRCRGTVKPPAGQIIIPVTGEYSVGGLCALAVSLTDPEVNLHASLMAPLPAALPGDVQKMREGCLLMYYRSSLLIAEVAPQSGYVQICFAANPGKQTTIYFYDMSSSASAWTPLETSLQNGIACAPATDSGVYVATFAR